MAAVVGDFTGTGSNTLCFNDFNETIFFQYDSRKPTISNFNGYGNDNTLFFS